MHDITLHYAWQYLFERFTSICYLYILFRKVLYLTKNLFVLTTGFHKKMNNQGVPPPPPPPPRERVERMSSALRTAVASLVAEISAGGICNPSSRQMSLLYGYAFGTYMTRQEVKTYVTKYSTTDEETVDRVFNRL